MLAVKPYNRQFAYAYAAKWAFRRNPLFYNFTGIGGDCTSFVSQCIYAGCCEMNYNKYNGWYYTDVNDRSPSWTSVSFFYDFIVTNKLNGPFGYETNIDGLETGDVVQLRNEMDRYYHTLIVTGFDDNNILVSAHSDDAFNRRLDSYIYAAGARYIHIEGIREYVKNAEVCFKNFYEGISLHS
ncbi:MAG: amidase domain-containing protein [Lachnospiraceae bacterium]|nr:amidase domain-containing protein [Lachnospiraceae bacterium]